MLLLGLYCETIIRSSGEKSVKFHEDHSLVLFTPTLSHRLWRCQLPDAKTQFVASTTLSHRLRRCQLPFREHIEIGDNGEL